MIIPGTGPYRQYTSKCVEYETFIPSSFLKDAVLSFQNEWGGWPQDSNMRRLFQVKSINQSSCTITQAAPSPGLCSHWSWPHFSRLTNQCPVCLFGLKSCCRLLISSRAHCSYSCCPNEVNTNNISHLSKCSLTPYVVFKWVGPLVSVGIMTHVLWA